MKQTEKPIVEIDPWKVKVFIHRERDPERFARIERSVERRGQLIPGQVRDIRDTPKEDRARPDGGYYDWGLITGEGRLLIAQRLGRKFRAFVENEKQDKVVGFFLAENLNREPLPWALKARLVRPELEAGRSYKQIAEKLQLTPKHVQKFERILAKVAPEAQDAVERMPMNDAEILTALPKDHQPIVLEVMKAMPDAQLKEIVKKAREVAGEDDGKLSPTALKKSIDRVQEELNDLRTRVKLKRLHHSLGPQNLTVLLKDKRIRKALEAEGVNLKKFDSLTQP